MCLLWRPELIWTQVTVDAVTGLAYYSIPFVLAYFAAKRPDFGFHPVIWCFVGFILACGTTHFMSIWTLWVPDYGLEALIKALTAILSVATAILLWWLLPVALRMPSPEQLNEANAALARHVIERDDALLALKKESEELQLAQDMLRQAQKMEAVGQLTGGVAHDFNNLLTAILLSLDRAAKEGGPNPKLEKSLKIATAAAERAAALTNQMLAFARKQPLRPASVAVNELIDNLTPLVRNILGERGVLALKLDPKVGNVWIDHNQLEQALLNLAVNARDAFETHGTMTVTTRPVNFQREGETIPGTEIAISDSGSGMSEEVKARAFDPFFTTKEVGKGSGLGLSQVYGFVQQSGGTIELHSKPGRGTRISIQLPITAKA
jgi:signal transduction histidine kinase